MADEAEMIHQGQPVLAAGEALTTARAALLMVHGRGASAEDILSFASVLAQPGAAYIAPQAAGHAWYPNSFSQGACLTLEYVARHARRYGAVIGWSGGLIGPDGAERDYPGRLDGAPVFLGCSDRDPHVPQARVELTAETLRGLGADVTMRIYPGMGHTVNDDEIAFTRQLLAALAV